jgi:hypothetical protein
MSAGIANSGIAAQAFRLLEQSPISSFGDDSPQAADAAEQYPVALDTCLAHCDWSFASRLADLPPALAATVDPDLPHAYARPSDLVTLRDVWPRCAAFRLDEDFLRADQAGPLRIRYTCRITDETRLPGAFRTAVAYELASLLAPKYTTSLSRGLNLHKASEDYLARARRDDRGGASGQRYDGRDREGDWVREAVSLSTIGRRP